MPEDEPLAAAVDQLLARLNGELEHRDVFYDGHLCDELHRTLRQIVTARERGQAVRAKLPFQSFPALAIIDTERAHAPGGIDFDELVRVAVAAIATVLDLNLDPKALHPEELTQLLKDEKRMLFCFLSAGLFTPLHLQRLRGLGFTQTDHRVLFCGDSKVLREKSARLAQVWKSLSTDEPRAVEFESQGEPPYPFARLHPGPPMGRADNELFRPGIQSLLCTYAANASELVGNLYSLSLPRVTIGRGQGSDIVVSEPTVSGRHAVLNWALGQWQVEDQGSTNGTYADYSFERKHAVSLLHGSEFQLANMRFKLVTFTAGSGEHERARDFLRQRDGLTNLLLPESMAEAFDAEAAFTEWTNRKMAVVRYTINSGGSRWLTVLEELGLRRAAYLVAETTASALQLWDTPVVAARTGFLEVAVATGVPSIADAHMMVDFVLERLTAQLPSSLTVTARIEEVSEQRPWRVILGDVHAHPADPASASSV